MKKLLTVVVAAMMALSFSMVAGATEAKVEKAEKAEKTEKAEKAEKKDAKKDKKDKKDKKKDGEAKPAAKGKKEVSGC